MLTTIEKVIALQDVDIFSEISTEQLAYLAAIASEESFATGQMIYQDQDHADSMYLVVEGRVRLHRNDLDVDIADPGKDLGSWALLDDEPRIMDATALEDSLLLRLDKDDFIDLLADNVEITQGVLKALVQRMRRLGRIVGGTQ